MPGFANVQPDPKLPGAYRATTADGQNFMVHGPPGEQLYKNFSAQNMSPAPPSVSAPRMGTTTVSRPDMQDEGGGGGMGHALLLANPLTGPATLAYDAVKKFSKRDEPTAPLTQPSAQSAQSQPSAPAPAAEQAQGQQAQRQEPGPLGYSMKGVDPATGKEIAGEAVLKPDGKIGIYVPGTRGSPGGLTKLGKEALQHSGEAEAEHAKQERIGEEARASGADAAMREASERDAYLTEQRNQALLQQQQQQDDNEKVQKQVGELQTRYDKARDDFMNSKVDPDAYMKGGHGGVAVFSALGMALGAFGAALARTPNFAQEFVQSQIDRKIRAQETQINVKGRAADNMLADLTRATGSMQNGKLAMRQLLTERAAIEAQQVGASSKVQAIAAKAKETSAALAADAALQDNARRQGLLEHVMGSRLYYAPGSPGRTGGFISPTQESYEKGRQGQIDVEKLKLAQAKEAAAAGKAPHIGQRQQAQIISARVAAGALDEYAQSLDIKRGKNGEYEDPSLMTTAASKIPYTETRQKVSALKNTLVAEIGKAQIGGALSEEEAHVMQKQIDSANTPGEIGAMVRHYDKTMKHVEETVRDVAASSGPGSDNEPDDSRR